MFAFRTRRRLPRWAKRWLWAGAKVALSVVFVLLTVVTLYGASVAHDIETRFAGRLWSVPSRVYSDGLLIFPGQELPLRQLVSRLERLGYRKTSRPPKVPGEYRRGRNALTIYLRRIRLPVLQRPAQRVRIAFSKRGGSVTRMTDASSGEDIAVLELEPEELLQVFGDQHQSRQLVARKEVPDAVIDALLSAEDADFYNHSGIDFTAVLRALYVNTFSSRGRQGGSTLTQQLAKTLFLTPERTIWRKLKEAIIAFVIEYKYDKDTILEIYLNEVYLGQRGSVAVHGFGEAARFYFGKRVKELSVAQSAMLAGIIPAPNRFSPYKNKEAATKRRNRVLKAMALNGKLDDAALEKALKSDLSTVPFTPYKRIAPYFFDYLANEVTTRYPQSELSRLGLSLYTSLDVGVQAEAERALERGLKALEKKRPKLKRPAGQPRLQGAIVVLHPTTGHILAMVGGRNYSESQFNRITQAKRQPGSAFKPFVYLAALESVPLNERLNNERRTYRINNKRWRPKNYTKEYGGTVSMREALMKSLNLPTIDLADKIGLDSVIETARDFGITTPLQPELSLALGAFEVVPLELALAYAAFAGDGVLPHALALRSVLDDEGKEVKRQHLKIRTVTTPARAFMMTSLLKDVVEHGTASSLKWRGIKYPVAGKTGTTNDYRDAWFVGYTPDIVTLVWVGYDDGKSIGLSASSAAVPIWADLMRRIRWRTSGQWFEAPPDVVTVEICRESGHIATDDCPHVTQEVFNAGEAPTQTCTVHMSSFGRFLDSIGL